ncbi:DMT family transporter [Pseudooctadecabacter jejudonensis]|uniref:EamA-like transporter family protein n=1 Tax=Pseudooctadecabacter jejudonensis TaxID=1391910 RepID=A0A1Y5RIZ0_9RHOB|nr:DMT family transporter [Pseudooctadecabacter jejudonensis]SLN18396.1 EamA-like transporter family protein [Pseudooctadecabacter jejudonensis]
MTLFLLITLVMVNFAANSVLSRAGIDVFGMDPVLFSGLRLASGAAMLALLVSLRGAVWPVLDRARMTSAGALLVYLVPFSVAYLTLPSGVGALILFGVVQVTMFAGSALSGVAPTPRQLVGMALAMAGLAWVLWPSEALALDPVGCAFMVLSGIGWGVFSLRGRGSRDPLGDMAWSFVLLAPVAALLMVLGAGWSLWGVGVAVVCGAVTSGLGYALWYRVLPQIAATTGAVAQLSVPVIALVAGALVLGEVITVQIVIAGAVVLGGIAVAVLKR